MSDMQSIFLQSHGAKLSTRKMPRAQADWGAFIKNELLKQHPSLSGRAMEVDYQSLDESQGYALGSVHVKNDDKMAMLYIPFIVERNELHPLDLFFKKGEGEPQYLTEDRIREVMFSERISKGLAPSPFNGAITDDGFDQTSPYQVSGVPGNGAKYASPLDHLGLHPDRGRFDVRKAVLNAWDSEPNEEMLSELVKHASAESLSSFDKDSSGVENSLHIETMRRNGTIYGLRKIAEAMTDAPSLETIKTAATEPVYDYNTAHIIKNGPDNYDALVSMNAPRGERLVKLAGIGYGVCSRLIETLDGNPNEEMQQVERSGERIISNMRPVDNSTHLVESLTPERWENLDGMDSKVNVFSPVVGASYSGYAFGKMVSLSGKDVKSKLFIKPGGPYAFQNEMAVEHIGKGLKDKSIGPLKEETPHVGTTAVFLFNDEDTDGSIATEPFEIVSIEKGRYAGPVLKVISQNGIEYTLRTNGSVLRPTKYKEFEKSSKSDGIGLVPYLPGDLRKKKESIVLIPRKAVMITLGRKVELSSKPSVAKNDTKLTRTSQSPIKVRQEEKGKISVKSASIRPKDVAEGWGLDMNSLSKTAAFHLLIAQGVEPPKADAAVKLACLGEPSEIHVPERKYKPELQQKLASAQFDAIERGLQDVKREMDSYNFIKLASSIPGAATVANILSVKMIGPETFKQFIANLPLLEKTLSFLGTLILTSRLDSTLNLEQRDISTAMAAVDSVIGQVKRMKAMSMPS